MCIARSNCQGMFTTLRQRSFKADLQYFLLHLIFLGPLEMLTTCSTNTVHEKQISRLGTNLL